MEGALEVVMSGKRQNPETSSVTVIIPGLLNSTLVQLISLKPNSGTDED